MGLAGWCAAGFLLLVTTMAIFAQLLAPHDPEATDLMSIYQGPSAQHWLGTDGTGRDIASRLMFGARTALAGPALIIALSLVASVPLALVAAWRGGKTSFLISRLFDILFAIPGILLAILAVAMFGTGLTAAVCALAIAYLPYTGRVVLAAAHRERFLPYVRALEVQGHPASRITIRHILRNLSPLIAGQATVAFAYALIDLASLSFLGLAVQPPTPDWGVMVSDRDALLQGHPMGVISAAVMIVLTVLSLFTLNTATSGEDL
ncbi:ABC transporter permease [Branchiibius hedensis]|uniref:ABC transporter permease n=1 Tax=Branchiibius hedensis TaxID=672460 RepID=UPI00319E7D0D